jgi:preprotein translocase subunit SecF
MDAKGNFADWKFNSIETLGFGFSLAAVAVSITLWATATFQSKDDAKEMRKALETRVESVELQVQQMRASLENIRSDVSYIRGRLEPKPNKE